MDIYGLILCIISILNVLCFIIMIYSFINYKKTMSTYMEQMNNSTHNPIKINNDIIMTFEDCEKIISNVIDDVYQNKYFLHYRLKDISVIPDMESEITSMTKEIISAFSEPLLENIYKYYNEDYFIALITRRVQLLLVDYTNKYKPNVK